MEAHKQAMDHAADWHQQGECESRNYEESIVNEARRIVAGDSPKLPAAEHLRVLLCWLDGAPAQRPDRWDGAGDPF